jgi:large subunit ribosomal protein L32e
MRKHPKFLPPNYGRKKRIKIRWRRPRGIDSKKRVDIAYMGAVPKIGWRSARATRGIHPSGMREIMVHNPSEIEDLKGMDVVVRISGGVGKKKRGQMLAAAKQAGLKVLNPRIM